MNEYEIEIFGISDYTEMHKITNALYENGINGEDIDEVGMYLQDNKPDSVFVECSELEEAINIINALGYTTDEDDNLGEETLRILREAIILEVEHPTKSIEVHIETETSIDENDLGAETLRILREHGVFQQMQIEIILHEEHMQIEGNAVDSGDADFDTVLNNAIAERLNNGELWIWCTVEVKVTIDGFTANDYLGCCSYDNEQEFKAGGYYDDMVETCKEDIQNQRSVDVVQILNKHLAGFTMGLQRRNGNIVYQRSSNTKKGAISLINDVIREKKLLLIVHARIYRVSEKIVMSGKIRMQLSYQDVGGMGIVVATVYDTTKEYAIDRLKKKAKENNWRVYDNGNYWNE
ncbi:hypothetical protein LCGC14_0923630 [marine sediment metagenome]|uniref:Uncharacterized protein n=1 Tax=marine sediment metagenome TaxID=412755 RepID=A0A0F9R8T0_9ZZZZ